MRSRLYSPGYIGGLTVPNRTVMTAMHTALSDDGSVNEALIRYFAARAEGGTGLIIVGASGVDPVRVNTHNVIGIYEDAFLPGLKDLASAIHRAGSRCFVQLFHPGRYARSAEYGGAQAVAPSAVLSRFTGEMPRALEEEEIPEIIRFYADAARRAKDAGFDGVEITAASGYLPAQFLSPLTNLRTDRYGGSPEKRLTFLKETIEAVKKTAGGDFPLILRLGANDLLEGGCSPSDAVETACRLEEAGADGISLTGGWHESPVPQLTMDVPAGILSHFARRMKENLGIPLILSNRLNPRLAEELLDSGAADFAGFGRALLADPDMVKKASAGDHKQIRPCIGCNQGCMDRIFFGKTIRCLVNPEAGRESEEIFRTAGGRAGSAASTASGGPGKSGSPLSLLIIGGGPAGLNYALGASRKGHSAVVWEKEAEPGGQILLAAGVEERRDFSRYIQWLQNACGEKKIPILTNRPAKAEAVIKAFDSGTFDRVVLATGSAPPATIPEKAQLESDGSVPVMHGWDVLKGLPAPGRKILITGDGGTALWTALKLASRSRLSADHYRFLSLYSMEDEKELKESLNSMQGAITILAPGGKFGSEMGKSSKWVYLSTLKDLGVKILKSSKAESVRKGRVSVRSGNGEPLELEADLLVDTLSLAPASPELHNELSHRGIPVSRIGEARGSCNLYTTVRSAYEEGVTI